MMLQEAKEDDNRLFKQICHSNRGFKRRIIKGALRSAHPVHDASAALIGAPSVPHLNTRVVGKLV